MNKYIYIYISLHRIVVLLPPSPTCNLHVFDFSTCKISFFSHGLGFNYVVYVIYTLEIAIRWNEKHVQTLADSKRDESNCFSKFPLWKNGKYSWSAHCQIGLDETSSTTCPSGLSAPKEIAIPILWVCQSQPRKIGQLSISGRIPAELKSMTSFLENWQHLQLQLEFFLMGVVVQSKRMDIIWL